MSSIANNSLIIAYFHIQTLNIPSFCLKSRNYFHIFLARMGCACALLSTPVTAVIRAVDRAALLSRWLVLHLPRSDASSRLLTIMCTDDNRCPLERCCMYRKRVLSCCSDILLIYCFYCFVFDLLNFSLFSFL